MDNYRLLPAVFMISLASCTVETLPEQVSDDTVSLTLCLDSGQPSSKASIYIDENAVNSIEVLGFNSKGDVLLNQSISMTKDMSVPVQKGQPMEIYVVANNHGEDLRDVASKNDFLSRRSCYDDMESGTMVMLGHLSGTFTTDSSVNVKLERMAAKIIIDTITVKISDKRYVYTTAGPLYAYMSRTPQSLTFGFRPSDTFVDAYESDIMAGMWSKGKEKRNEYADGDYSVWEWIGPWSLYAYPNSNEDRNKRSVLALRYWEVYNSGAYWDNEHHVLTHANEDMLYLVLPPVRPNTVYELKKIVIIGSKNKTIYLPAVAGEGEPDVYECEFLLRDITTGMELGTEKGEVWYAAGNS